MNEIMGVKCLAEPLLGTPEAFSPTVPGEKNSAHGWET